MICQSHSIEELYSAADLYSVADLRFAVDCFPLHFFLWTFLALRSSLWVFRPCFLLGFLPHGLLDKDSQNWASTGFSNFFETFYIIKSIHSITCKLGRTHHQTQRLNLYLLHYITKFLSTSLHYIFCYYKKKFIQ